ncbi:MAG TPA: DUF5996 family protein [Ramlibacter sp.]|nr:DUF5996 family protein [Ramlibacter sp.]
METFLVGARDGRIRRVPGGAQVEVVHRRRHGGRAGEQDRGDDPEATLLQFMETTYRAAAALRGWDTNPLEA